MNWVKKHTHPTTRSGRRMRRPIQIGLIGVVLVVACVMMSGCNTTGSETSGFLGVTYHYTSPNTIIISGNSNIDYTWWDQNAAGCSGSVKANVDGVWNTGYDAFISNNIGSSFSEIIPVPDPASGGTVTLRRWSYAQVDYGSCSGDALTQWSQPITIAPYSGQLQAKLFTHASPAGEAGTIIDARTSVGGTAPYTYTFSPAGCDGTTAPGGGGALPTGEASVSIGVSGACNVTVTDANNQTSSASVSLPSGSIPENGTFSFTNNSATISVTGVISGGGTACVDPNGGSNYQAATVPLIWDSSLGAAHGLVALLDTTAGVHEITAQLYNTTEDCSHPTANELFQTIADLYQGNGVALTSARRTGQGNGVQLLTAHPKPYTANSSLRFVPKKTVKIGTENIALGLFKGGIVNGAFTWISPRRAKGVTRPAGLSALVHGTYVMQSNAMYFGPPLGDATALLGTGTVLFHGIGNTYECAGITSTLGGSVLTLLGGQGASTKLNGSVKTATVTYNLPIFKKKAKPPLPKASRKTGIVIASTGRKGLALPKVCRNLKKYLP